MLLRLLIYWRAAMSPTGLYVCECVRREFDTLRAAKSDFKLRPISSQYGHVNSDYAHAHHSFRIGSLFIRMTYSIVGCIEVPEKTPITGKDRKRPQNHPI